MRLHSLYGLTALACSSFVACAHSGSTSPAAGESAPVADANSPTYNEAATSLQEHHRHHHNGGVTGFIAMGLDTLGADPNKRGEIEKIEGELNAKLTPARDAEKHLVQTLADGIAAGNIDTNRVNADLDQMSKAAASAHDATTTSLNELHAALSPAERAALAEKVQAHWEVWRKVNHEAEPGGQEEDGRLSHVARELNLTPDQVNNISGQLHKSLGDEHKRFDGKDVEAHVQAFSTAFASDKFDARSLAKAAAANGDLATHGARRMVLFYETLVPVLTPEQRTKLSEKLRDHLNFQQAHG